LKYVFAVGAYRTVCQFGSVIAKIDKAIDRIDNGTYGYCEETGDPIRLGRLEARPIATLSLEAQEMHENAENARR